jgi:hypothetical protein
MDTAFVSHTSPDKHFVDLLIRVLNYHHIQTWWDSHDVEAGEKYKEEIGIGLQKAEYLIVVISQGSLNSKWIVREISSFAASKPVAKIIFVVIEKVNFVDVFEGLEDYQVILFHENMLEGFIQLLEAFGKDFLPERDRRNNMDRRLVERREFDDRRKAQIVQRLRKGFWKCYSSATDICPFDDFDLLPSNRIRIIDILKSEMEKYEYFDSDGNRFELTEKEFDKITYEVWEDMSSRDYVTAINVIEGIAEKIYNTYNEIKLIQRREEKRRRGIHRREDD